MAGTERKNGTRIGIAHYGDVAVDVVDGYSFLSVHIKVVDGPFLELFLNNDDPQITAAWKRLAADLGTIQALKDSA